MKKNQVSGSVSNAEDAPQPAQPATAQNSVSENFIFLLSAVKTKKSERISKSACSVENVPWYVPEESIQEML